MVFKWHDIIVNGKVNRGTQSFMKMCQPARCSSMNTIWVDYKPSNKSDRDCFYCCEQFSMLVLESENSAEFEYQMTSDCYLRAPNDDRRLILLVVDFSSANL